jgi:TonB family protein
VVANEWLDAQHADDQRQFQRLLVASFAVHAMAFAIAAFAPSPDPPPLPQVLRVDLVAGLPAPRAAAPAPAAKKAPAPAPAPAPPKALPQPKQVVLPKEAPKAVPPVKKKVAPPPRPKEVDYEDAMAQLRNEMGESVPDPRVVEDVSDADLLATTRGATSDAATGTGGSTLDKDTARWVLETQRHVRDRWITPPEFLNRSLTTVVEVELTALGDVVGKPGVRRSSGDPFFDDNAVRAVMKSSPLPAPPRSGKWTFSFSEE